MLQPIIHARIDPTKVFFYDADPDALHSLTACAWFAEDGTLVVQLDTGEDRDTPSRVRVNVNDGTVFDQDVESGEDFLLGPNESGAASLRRDYLAWVEERRDLIEADASGTPPRSSEWQASDDVAFDLLARFAGQRGLPAQ